MTFLNTDQFVFLFKSYNYIYHKTTIRGVEADEEISALKPMISLIKKFIVMQEVYEK